MLWHDQSPSELVRLSLRRAVMVSEREHEVSFDPDALGDRGLLDLEAGACAPLDSDRLLIDPDDHLALARLACAHRG